MMDILLCILWFLTGWLSRERLAKFRVEKMQKTNEIESKENTIVVTIDKFNDTFLVYDKDNGTFLMQVKTREEMFQTFRTSPKYSGLTIIMSKEDLKMFDVS